MPSVSHQMEQRGRSKLIRIIAFLFGTLFAMITGITRMLYPDEVWSYIVLAFTIIFVIVSIVIVMITSSRDGPEPTTLEQEEPIGEDLPDAEVVSVCCPACMTKQQVKGIRPFEVDCGRCGVTLVIPEKGRFN